MKLLIVDDHILFREGIVSLFARQPDIQIVGTSATVQGTIETALETRPDVVLMDFSLPDGTGLDATKAILSAMPQTKIVFLTMHDEDDRLFQAIQMGAIGYLLKNMSVNDLIDYVRKAYEGEAAFPDLMVTKMVDMIRQSNGRRPLPEEIGSLTMREIDILKEMSNGASNQEIADNLSISLSTVKNHVSNILSKLNVKNRHQAIAQARSSGLLDSIR